MASLASSIAAVSKTAINLQSGALKPCRRIIIIINGKNRPVYNQVLGRQIHSSKTANITLVRLHLER